MVLHNYEYFVAIVDEGSLTKAAEHLYVSQPSLSQYLKRLEANLGVELFDRSASPLRLTYTGERYYQYVLQMMKLDENIRREFQDIKNQTSGRLRLGVALWRGACLLPDVFPSFHRQYPDIHIELTEGRSVQLESACPPTHLRHQSGQRSQTAEWNHPRALSPAGGRPPRPLHLRDHRTLLREKGYLPAGRNHGRIRSLKHPPKNAPLTRNQLARGAKL